MDRIPTLAAAGLATLSLAVPTLASIPGNLDQRSREGLQHVCVDEEPGDADYVACQLQEGGFVDAPYTGEECTAAGLEPVCELDFVPKVRLKGTVTIAYDDTPRSGTNAAVTEQTAIVLDLKVKKKKVRLIELFEGSKIGNWNTIGIETGLLTGGIVFTNPSETAFQFANDNLTDLGDRIVALAQEAFPKADVSSALPVVTRLERIEKKNLDASGADPTATSTVWKLVLEFVRVRE